MKKPKLNVRLLRKIQKHITEEPRRFLMSTLLITHEDDLCLAGDAPASMPPCGTVACIAGWAHVLTGGRKTASPETIRRNAARAIGIKDVGSWEGNTLFMSSDWPHPFAGRYIEAKTPNTRANIACERIDHLIKTGE